MRRYPVLLSGDDNGTVLVAAPDFPGAATFGEDPDEALLHAVDAIETALQGRIAARDEVPLPSAVAGDAVELSMRSGPQGGALSGNAGAQSAQGRPRQALGLEGAQVDRLFDLRYASRLAQLEAAFGALGKRIEVQVSDARG